MNSANASCSHAVHASVKKLTIICLRSRSLTHSLAHSLTHSLTLGHVNARTQNLRMLERLLQRARGKVGLDRTRKLLKKAIKVSKINNPTRLSFLSPPCLGQSSGKSASDISTNTRSTPQSNEVRSSVQLHLVLQRAPKHFLFYLVAPMNALDVLQNRAHTR